LVGAASVTSANANVSVGADTTAPTNETATVDAEGTALTLTFSEVMGASAGVAANYRIDGIAPVGAVLTNGTNVIITLSVLDPCLNHIVIIQPAVMDPSGNAVEAASRTKNFRVPFILINKTHVWKYDDNGVDLGTAWQAAAYNDSTWKSGPSILAWEPENNLPAGWTLGTSLTNYTNAAFAAARPVFYFRTHFNLPTHPASLIALEMFQVVDDGCAVYLNGQRVNTNHLTDPITFATLTAGSFGDSATAPHPVEGPFALSTSALVQGDNVLAVEVHEGSLTSSDKVWGAILRATSNGCGTGLRIIPVSATQARLEWSDATFKVQTAPAITGPWATQNGLSTGSLISINSGNQFLRLIKQ